MNGYEAEEFRSFVPPGWDRWYAAASALMKKQFNNNGTIVSARSRTFDQKVAGKGLNFVESQAPSNTPFMAAFNFYAPHYPAENLLRSMSFTKRSSCRLTLLLGGRRLG
jgi:hypothetical protein